MGMGAAVIEASLVAWFVAQQAGYMAAWTDHPILGWRADRTKIFGVEQMPSIRQSSDTPMRIPPILGKGLPPKRKDKS
jgi:hypothetical protein